MRDDQKTVDEGASIPERAKAGDGGEGRLAIHDLPPETLDKLRELARKIGRQLAREVSR